MRTYGRVFAYNPDGTKQQPQPEGFPYWVVVQTDPTTGSNAWVYLLTLCQVLQGFLNESPFWANFGLPAIQSVLQQIAPDYNVQRTQQQFAQYFASLSVARNTDTNVPTYDINAVMPDGTPASMTVQPPQ